MQQACPLSVKYIECLRSSLREGSLYVPEQTLLEQLSQQAQHAGNDPVTLLLRVFYAAEAGFWRVVNSVQTTLEADLPETVFDRSREGLLKMQEVCKKMRVELTAATAESMLAHPRRSGLYTGIAETHTLALRAVESTLAGARSCLRESVPRHLHAAVGKRLAYSLDAVRTPPGTKLIVAQELLTISSTNQLRPWTSQTTFP